MDTEQIEKLLRKTPAIKPPTGLLEKLTDDIRLPRAQSRIEWSAPPSLFKRWLPALSFITIFLVCFVVLAVQTNVLTTLRRENELLRTKPGNLEALQLENAEVQRLRNENQELDRLRKDNLELQQLRGEVAQLRIQLQGLDNLRMENQRLKMRAGNRPSAVAERDELTPAEQAKTESLKCISNMKQIGLAFRIWEGDNNDALPNDFISMTNELGTWLILKCPSDKSRNVSGWGDVQAGNVSYRRVSSGPGVNETKPNIVLFECPIHGHIALIDGSVQGGSPETRQRLKLVDGITYFER